MTGKDARVLASIPEALRRLSVALAVLIATLPLLGFWIISHQHKSDQLRAAGELIAHTISKEAYLYPDSWDLQVARLEHIVDGFRPRNLTVNITIQDKNKNSLLELVHEDFAYPHVSTSAILGDDGIVGFVTLETTLLPMVYSAAIIGSLLLVLAWVVLAAINRYSIRGINRAVVAVNDAHKNLDRQRRYLDGILSSSENVAIVATNNAWIIRYFNHTAAKLFDLPVKAAPGLPLHELHQSLHAPVLTARTQESLGTTVAERNFDLQLDVDNQTRDIEARLSVIVGKQGKVHGYTLMCTDVTAQRRAAELIEYQATYDSLTDLPNRRSFLEQLEKALARGKIHGHRGAVLFLDLDNFKNINDSLGHAVGDGLLKEVAARLQACLSEEDTVGRLGGDEFVVLLPELSDETNDAINRAQAVAQQVQLSFAQPFAIPPYRLHVSPSIGISLFPSGDSEAEDILQQADTAMYRAKEAGCNTLRFFLPSMQRSAEERMRLLGDLRQAIERCELVSYFQPIFDGQRSLVGTETLVRWQHPANGLIMPDAFIPLAEDSGLILQLGRWVLEDALTTLQTWMSAGRVAPDFRIAVNISPQQFRQSDFVGLIEDALVATGVGATNLCLEMTEGVLLDSTESALEKILALRGMGVRFSIDDFGTGYSSLAYLKRLPVNQLKIDRSFVRDVLDDEGDAALVETIVTLASRLNLATVAEGVETEAQYGYLTRIGCSGYQGSLFSPPVPQQVFEANYLAPTSVALNGA